MPHSPGNPPGGEAGSATFAESLRLLEVQRDLALALTECDDLPVCLGNLLDHALRLPPFDCGGAYLLDEDNGMLRLIAHRGLSEEFIAKVSSIPPDGPHLEQIESRVLFCGRREELHPDVAAPLVEEGLDSLVVIPLFCAGRLIGSLNLSSRLVPEISPSTHAAVVSIAAFVGTAFENLHTRRQRLDRLVEERTRDLADANAQLSRQTEALELALDASEAGLREVDLLTGKIHWDSRGRSLAGYESEEHPIGLDRVLQERIHPASRADFELMLKEIASPSGPTHWNHEFMIDHPTRGLRWLGGRGKVFRDETGRPVRLIGIISDITERKKAEELLRNWNATLELQVAARTRELKASEDRFRVLADATFEGIVISTGGIVIDANHQAAAMFGYEPAEIIGRPTLSFVAPESLEQVVEHFSTRPTEPLQWQGLVKDGSCIPVASQTRLEPRKSEEVRITAIRDLRPEQKAQTRLEAMRAELERATGLALISEVSQSIIHQLSQPLTAVGNQLEVAGYHMTRCAKDDCAAMNSITSVKTDLHQVREVVTHLRSLAKPQQSSRAATSLNQVIGEVLPLLLREGETASVAIRTALEAGLPEISANAVQLKQVLVNLVRNAVESCASAPPSEGGTVWITTRTLQGEGLELTVRDNGPGFAHGIAGQLFTVFTTSKPEGTGIGLKLCQRIVRAHHGTIEGLPNPDGPGVTFRIRLPLPDAMHDDGEGIG